MEELFDRSAFAGAGCVRVSALELQEAARLAVVV
jgi:hypothetical protein